MTESCVRKEAKKKKRVKTGCPQHEIFCLLEFSFGVDTGVGG